MLECYIIFYIFDFLGTNTRPLSLKTVMLKTSNSCFTVPPIISAFEFVDNPMNSGDAASVLCSITKGDFPVDFTWLLNGRRVVNDDYISIMRSNKRTSQLSIDSVQAEHAGVYVCIAHNKAGNSSHSTSLQVNGTFRDYNNVCFFFFNSFPNYYLLSSSLTNTFNVYRCFIYHFLLSASLIFSSSTNSCFRISR